MREREEDLKEVMNKQMRRMRREENQRVAMWKRRSFDGITTFFFKMQCHISTYSCMFQLYVLHRYLLSKQVFSKARAHSFK